MGWCFSSRVNENTPVSAETQLRLSSHEKTKPTYIVSFVGDTEQQNQTSSTGKNYYRPAFGNEIPQCRQKNISRGDLTTNVRCCFFLFNPPIIFGRCLLGNVWIGVIRWFFFFRPGSVIFPGRRHLAFFSRSISLNHYFIFPRWANVFLAD